MKAHGKSQLSAQFCRESKTVIKIFFVVLMVFVKGMRFPTLSDFAVLVWNVTKEQDRQSRGQKEKLFYRQSRQVLAASMTQCMLGWGDPRKLIPLDPSSPVHS